MTLKSRQKTTILAVAMMILITACSHSAHAMLPGAAKPRQLSRSESSNFGAERNNKRKNFAYTKSFSYLPKKRDYFDPFGYVQTITIAPKKLTKSASLNYLLEIGTLDEETELFKVFGEINPIGPLYGTSLLKECNVKHN
jgi:hypothetical protein